MTSGLERLFKEVEFWLESGNLDSVSSKLWEIYHQHHEPEKHSLIQSVIDTTIKIKGQDIKVVKSILSNRLAYLKEQL